jgi:hypothetical protein
MARMALVAAAAAPCTIHRCCRSSAQLAQLAWGSSSSSRGRARMAQVGLVPAAAPCTIQGSSRCSLTHMVPQVAPVATASIRCCSRIASTQVTQLGQQGTSSICRVQVAQLQGSSNSGRTQVC